MKKFINAADTVESEMIRGMQKAYPDKIRVLDGTQVFLRKEKKRA